MKQHNEQKGFTIIEVVLVLAIAALIFLVVFLAVPALQRSQRDTQRRTDLGRFQTAIVNYAGNHQGKIPLSADMTNAWLHQYVRANGADRFEDPSGNTSTGGTPATAQYNITTGTVVPSYTSANNSMYYRTGVICNAANTTTNYVTATGATPRSFAVLVPLESGDVACQDNR